MTKIEVAAAAALGELPGNWGWHNPGPPEDAGQVFFHGGRDHEVVSRGNGVYEIVDSGPRVWLVVQLGTHMGKPCSLVAYVPHEIARDWQI